MSSQSATAQDYVYVHQPPPHVEEHKQKKPVKVADQGGEGFNSRLALLITTGVGTMITAYIFAAIALLSLPSALQSGNLTIIVAWISSNFLQLVLLPIIIVGQNLQARASDKRAADTYKDAEAIFHLAHNIQMHLDVQDQHLAAQDAHLQGIITAIGKAFPNVPLQKEPLAS
jgi:hypothetical protein